MDDKNNELIDFALFEKRKRAAFINSLSGFKSLNLLGSADKNKQTNLSVVSSAFHIGAEPALMGIIFRPHTTPRHSFENIIEMQDFTLNHVHEDILTQAHQTSARYQKEESEFEQVGLTPLFRDGHWAPFVGESHLQLALKLREHNTLHINKTEMVIAEIIAVYANKEMLCESGYFDIEKAQSLCVSGLDSYHKTIRLKRLSYAKPKAWPREITD